MTCVGSRSVTQLKRADNLALDAGKKLLSLVLVLTLRDVTFTKKLLQQLKLGGGHGLGGDRNECHGTELTCRSTSGARSTAISPSVGLE